MDSDNLGGEGVTKSSTASGLGGVDATTSSGVLGVRLFRSFVSTVDEGVLMLTLVAVVVATVGLGMERATAANARAAISITFFSVAVGDDPSGVADEIAVVIFRSVSF